MEVFCRNVPVQVQDKHLKREFTPHLAKLGIHVFHCRKLPQRNAIITIHDASRALKLLAMYGQDQNRTKRPAVLLKMFGSPIYLSKGRNVPDEFLIRTLQNEEEKRLAHAQGTSTTHDHGARRAVVKRPKSFFISTMSCGLWEYAQNTPVFIECFRSGSNGKIAFKKTGIQVTIETKAGGDIYHLEFSYYIVESIHTGTAQVPSVTITANTAPRLYVTDPVHALAQKMASTGLQKGYRGLPPKERVSHFGGDHEELAGKCFTYRFLLLHPDDLRRVYDLSNERHIPKIASWNDHRAKFDVPYSSITDRFMGFLKLGYVEYRIQFQLQKLVWNGEMNPEKAVKFISQVVMNAVKREDIDVIIKALSRLSNQNIYPSPDIQAAEVDIPALEKLFLDDIDSVKREKEMSRSNRPPHPNNIQVHRAQVTPCGIYLYGPSLETKNRVLRKFADHVDHFLRVEFVDESGDPVRYDPRASVEYIFQTRFKSVMKNGINIGGRKFEFLGFSHSSLRSQTCWFVAPFSSDGILFNATTIIQSLGKFDHINSPAKQAARIGQTFSETLTSIPVSNDVIRGNDDVTRNGRTFSDGVGTISPAILYRIWRDYSLRAKVKPTVFQIRCGGAKGMISVDHNLTGEALVMRESMIKFPSAPDSFNIEICGSGIRALPFFLNAPLIKILEDLGVRESSFLKLQADEISRLRATAVSTKQAAAFLEDTNIAKSVGLPWLIQILEGFGLHHADDEFLRRVMELAVLIKLRDLKYRARIRVPQAVTLYGIMDETGFLKEGEIFCCSLNETGFREVLVKDKVVVTRSPAMHPGDLQVARAVDVPADSPLRKLHNCIAFSQFGNRDLPSMLSGGDLDGDLYNIIYDETLFPVLAYPPAEYPPVEENKLDRPVMRDDIMDFFVTFMQQDQLGRIATIHQAIADQSPSGVFAPDCLRLAELYSTAVDFSKSGVPVDLDRIPRFPRYRPDFMAPGPRVHIEESLTLLEENEQMTVQDDDDDDDERPPTRFYKSTKVLGTLYRSIDEQEFLFERRNARDRPANSNIVLMRLWDYIREETKGFVWDHLLGEARNIREIYEDNLTELMHEYSATPWKSSITEYEVFLGNILGHGQKLTQRQKDASKEMREHYEDLVDFTNSMIQDRGSGGVESLERSIACFYIAIKEDRQTSYSARRRDDSISSYRQHNQGWSDRSGRKEKLISFPWIAAIACLKEVDKFQQSLPF
ncbi:hypothetical protein FQN55_004435 [Onygenales sp. PD_40]|nr:hypothetical protein FQN55_004435 [Onygenales sp. PD_40]